MNDENFEDDVGEPDTSVNGSEQPNPNLCLPIYPMWTDVVEAYSRLHLLARLTQTSAANQEPDLAGIHRCTDEDRGLVLRLAVNAPTPMILHQARLANQWFLVLLDGWVLREGESYADVLDALHDEVFGSSEGYECF